MTVPRVGIVMGSDSDWSIAAPARDILNQLGVGSEVRVLSAHRTPHMLLEYGAAAADRGLGVLIGAAGGAAHLPGMLASVTTLPVIGLPVPLSRLDGMDSLLSIVQMPPGIPVATVAIGAGQNAGLLAARILAVGDPTLRTALADYQQELAETSRGKDDKLRAELDAPE
jgi:5-(carboxyamino)imidazole ribonucleotide mutase